MRPDFLKGHEGFYLEEDDHIVKLMYKGFQLSIYSSSGAIQESILKDIKKFESDGNLEKIINQVNLN
jgi:hypothetical protein